MEISPEVLPKGQPICPRCKRKVLKKMLCYPEGTIPVQDEKPEPIATLGIKITPFPIVSNDPIDAIRLEEDAQIFRKMDQDLNPGCVCIWDEKLGDVERGQVDGSPDKTG
jgi:hypothetical protein